jgi:hypothetical protein
MRVTTSVETNRGICTVVAQTTISEEIAIERAHASSGSSELATGIAEIIMAEKAGTAYSLPKIYTVHPHLVESASEVFEPTDVTKEIITEKIPELREKS